MHFQNLSNMFSSLEFRLGTIAFCLALPLCTFSQTLPTQTTEKIEVTGSNLKRIDLETASPIQIITREDIERAGKQSLSDVIRSLPVDNNGSISTAFANGLAAGASGVSLRGLSVNSTLVLLNGRRMAFYGYADDLQRNFVDLSSIPLEAVERIEILKDGASAIYGSDAIGGVVNIILRKNYQGISGTMSYGQSRYGDGKTKTVTLAGGFGDLAADKYNLFANLEVSSQDAIWQRDRAGRDWIGSGDLRPYGYSIQVGGLAGYFRNSPLSANRYVNGSLVGNVRNQASPTLDYQSLPGCTSAISVARTTASPVAGEGGCVWDITQYQQIQPEEQKLNFFGRGTFQISPALQAYTEVGLFKSDVTTYISPSAVSVTWAGLTGFKTNTNIRLPAGHPDNPFSGSSRLRYSTGDVGPRRNEYDTTVTRFLVGIKGTWDEWDFDTGALQTESKTDRTAQGYLRNSVLVQNPALSTLAANPLVNLNYRIGDDAGLNSRAFYDQLSPTLNTSAKTTLSTFDFKASRDLMQLDGGPLALALGAEYRHESIDSPSLPGTNTGDIVGVSYTAYRGSRNVSAAFAELAAPVLNNLELNAAVRADHYSDYGNSATPKLGFKWKPVQTFALRGTYSEGFRAPGAAENGSSAAAGLATYVDPVRCPLTNSATDCGGGAVLVLSTGNPNVKPEKSKSYTFGLLFQPSRNTNLAIDFWKINRKSEITAADPNLILQNPALFPTAVIVRDTTLINSVPGTGAVLAISAPYINSSKTETNGIDIDLKHKMTLGSLGNVTASLNWTYIDSFKKTLPNGATLEYAGTHGPTILSGNAGMPRNRGLAGLVWEQDVWNIGTNLNFVSSYSNKESTNGPCLIQFANGSDAPGGCKVSSFTTTDLFGKWKIEKNLELNGSISNVFDRVAPLDPETIVSAVNYNPTYHLAGAIGRYFQIGVKYTFK